MERTGLIAARARRHWTLEQAADYLQVDADTLYRWEKGKSKPRAYNIELLCAAYGMSVAQLGIEDSAPNTDAPEIPALYESKAIHDEVVAEAVRRDFSLRLIRLVWLWPRTNLRYEELQRHIMNETEDFNGMSDADHPMTRRDALRRLALLPIEMSGLTALGTLVRTPAEEFLPLCAASITACWYLMNGSDFTLVEHVLPHFLPRLEALAKQPSRIQKEAARLASHGHQLAYVITSHQEDFNAALMHCKQAYIFGQLASDRNLQASALVRQGVTFLYRKRPLQTLQSYQQALPVAEGLSPLLRARLYAGFAEVYGKLGEEQEARRNIGLAYEHFPEHTQQDPASLYVHFEHSSLFLHEGLALLDLHQPADAARALAQVDGIAPKLPVSERSRIDFLNQQATAAVIQNDLEQFSLYIEAAVKSALALGSDLRYSEAWDVYKSALSRWYHEPRMKALGELFVK
jgi:transcriptional regulator with XRE-family HTH domain